MPAKIIEIPAIGPVRFIKSSRNRSIRISLTNKSEVRVSLPVWSAYASAISFVEQNVSWIQSELQKRTRPLLLEGLHIGKLHILHFEQVPNTAPVTTKTTATKLLVRHRANEPIESETVQARARQAGIRALKKEATAILPDRLRRLSIEHGFEYASVSVKPLQRRWGSCDSHRAITLNIYLLQLTWEQIDYVLCHELTHTVHMNHSEAFWERLTLAMPRARDIAKFVRKQQPDLQPQQSTTPLPDDVAY